jgi:saccharopine dehydrogenase (NAD+, L-lysine-forming)
MSQTWMIYGVNGYTGRILAERAKAEGRAPILAGRREDAVRPLAEALSLPHRIFSLDDPAAVDAGLEGVGAVVHCAGPFSKTSAPMVDGCLRRRTHYLDITGEVEVFEAVFTRDKEARDAGVVLLPGAGFDVVPTDCLAAGLKERLPDAIELELAFQDMGSLSAGTMKTMVEGPPTYTS